MSHELSTTVQLPNGKWINLPTVVQGREEPLSPDEARDLFMSGRLRSLGGTLFNSPERAVEAAKARSDMFRDRGEQDPVELQPLRLPLNQ